MHHAPRSRTFLLLIAALALWLAPAHADAAQTAKTFKGKVNDKEASLEYLLYLPKGYEKSQDKAWPLMLFLHGAGERGDDINRVKVHGPPRIVEAGKDLPFIVISPQCPRNQWWNADELMALVDDVAGSHRVDKGRIYVTGLSMGGFGTWSLVTKYPDRFAAAVPICGRGDPTKAANMKHVPTWVFHGDQDRAVPIDGSKKMVEALKEAGGNVRFTIYEGVGHDSWTQTYNNPDLYKWLLEQKRTDKKDQ